MSPPDAIAIEVFGRIQVLRFTRPEKKNAINSAMYRALADALEAAEATDGIAAHVFAGAAGVFSAGNDLTDFLKPGAERDEALSHVLRFIRLLPRIRKPMIGAVDGLAVGIGTTLLFHCDLVFASGRSTFSAPFLDLGLVPEAGSSLLAPQRLGYARAFELLVLGATFSAERLREAGLINAIHPPDEVEAAAIDAAKALSAKPPEALRIARRLLRGDIEEVSRRIDAEAGLFVERLSSPEATAALTAFTQKRAAGPSRQ
jgi:enoyl-CoA hydratase/carnithine racemase